MAHFKYKLRKALMVCLGLKPGAARWNEKTNPLSCGGTTAIGLLDYNNNALMGLKIDTFKWAIAIPNLTIVFIFGRFKHQHNFYQKYMWKWSRQYTVLGSKLTTCLTRATSHNL